jgi:serine/threonine protein kinase
LFFTEGGMPEDRMENQQPRSKPVVNAKSPPSKGAPVFPPAPDTKMVQDTATPEENDPLWEQLGATRVVEGPSDSSFSGLNIDSAANYTEMTPSRVLGKNLMTLGDFELVKKLGEGAMGAVYKAMQVTSNGDKLDRPRVVALKVLFPHVASNPKLVDRLHREGRVMGLLDHPNIVQAYATDEAEGFHYVAMEYIAGQSMQKWLTQLGKLPVGDAVRITLDCAKALQYAHSQNMVHRDIKPDNILLTRTGIVKVADLGMVKVDDQEMSLTQTGHAVGTPWYMPLEQARNAKEIDGRSDIYALGCTLYAFLTGNPPFMGRTIVDVIQAKEVGTFAPARQSNSNVPERLDLMIAKMTAKAPKYRYQTCDELIKDLESLGLASETLSFVRQKFVVENRGNETPMPGKTSVMASAAKSKTDAESAEDVPTLDPDVWYVQMKAQDGAVMTRKYNTTQLQKMVAEGTIAPTARASHDPKEGFRSLATYKEFQGTALSKLSKKAADKHTARYRGIYKKIEEEDRHREEKEREAKKDETAVSANTRYWGSIALTVVPIAVGVIVIIVGLILIAKFL